MDKLAMASLNQFFTKPFHKLVLSLWPTSAMSVCTFLFNCFHNWTACCVISMFQTLVSKSLFQYIINWISCPEALFDVEASIRHRPTPYCVSFYNSWDPKSSPTQAHIHIYSNSMTTLKSHRDTANMNLCCKDVFCPKLFYHILVLVALALACAFV